MSDAIKIARQAPKYIEELLADMFAARAEDKRVCLGGVYSGQQYIQIQLVVTCDPAAILGIDAGSLSVGSAADVCLFDPDEVWRATPNTLRSQGKNTPFVGCEVRGRVRMTLVGGRIVFEA